VARSRSGTVEAGVKEVVIKMLEPTREVIEIRPQERQEVFLSTPADIAIYGGAAGGGKTWALLLEPLRHWKNRRFGAVIFRRSIPEITREGGLWDEAQNIYPYFGAQPNKNEHHFEFPKGMTVTFSHMQYEEDKNSWKSSQIPLIEWDQLETFLESQFFYMISRNRSTCGVRPYIRATANPEPGWLADFLAWWIDDDGYAIPERSGVIRWMVRENDKIIWADTEEELTADNPSRRPKSVTFILATIYDNHILMEKDPGYLANLMALPYVDRERLLGDARRGGNWKIKPAAGKIFNRAWFGIEEAAPLGMRIVRFWDFAATQKEMTGKKKGNDPDHTVGVKMGMIAGLYFVLDLIDTQAGPAEVDKLVYNTAVVDGTSVEVRWEIEPGSSGKRDTHHLATMLAGWDARGEDTSGDKITRAKGLAAQALAGNVKLIKNDWNEYYLNQMHGVPDLPHDDVMDASSGAFNVLTDRKKVAGAWGVRKK
jgi:predicted phage terminase large subunit-like protein